MVCNKKGHKAPYYLSCDTEGNLTIGPNAGSTGVELPDCSNFDEATKTPICDRSVLGVFSNDQEGGNNCKKDQSSKNSYFFIKIRDFRAKNMIIRNWSKISVIILKNKQF